VKRSPLDSWRDIIQDKANLLYSAVVVDHIIKVRLKHFTNHEARRKTANPSRGRGWQNQPTLDVVFVLRSDSAAEIRRAGEEVRPGVRCAERRAEEATNRPRRFLEPPFRQEGGTPTCFWGTLSQPAFVSGDMFIHVHLTSDVRLEEGIDFIADAHAKNRNAPHPTSVANMFVP